MGWCSGGCVRDGIARRLRICPGRSNHVSCNNVTVVASTRDRSKGNVTSSFYLWRRLTSNAGQSGASGALRSYASVCGEAAKQFRWRFTKLRRSRDCSFVQYDRESNTLHVSYIRFLPVINTAKVCDLVRSLFLASSCLIVAEECCWIRSSCCVRNGCGSIDLVRLGDLEMCLPYSTLRAANPGASCFLCVVSCHMLLLSSSFAYMSTHIGCAELAERCGRLVFKVMACTRTC